MPFTFQQEDLPVDRARDSDFATWKAQWDSYISLSGLGSKDDTKKVQALMLCFSCDTLTIVQNLGLLEDERKNVNSIIDAIKHYIEGHVN